MTRPDLVIFDCDGVLVDSEPVSNRVMADNLTRHGLPLTLDQALAHFVGLSMPGVATKARALGADLPADWQTEVDAEINAALARGVAPIPGIPALLDRLEADGIRYCVASNGAQAKMDVTLGVSGLAPRIDGRRFSAHDIGVAKPDPALFLAAARALGTDPAACLVIEDSASGAEAAARAAMVCLGYAPTGDGAALRAHGAQVIRSMAAVPALIGLT